MKDTRRMKAVLLMAACLAFVMSPWWSGGFGGFRPDQFPVPQDDPPVQPAGYAFSIWGLIYVWLLISAGYGLVKRAEDAAWDATRWPLIASLGFGASWIAVAQISPLGATGLIWFMLIAALLGLSASGARERWLLRVPISIYAGWLTAASCVSIGLIGAGYGIGPGAVGWAWISVAIATGLGVAVQLRIGAVPGYGLTLAWALIAIAVQNYGVNTGLVVAAGMLALGFAALPFALARRAGR